MKNKRYNQFSAYLREKFGTKVYKITIDAGFSCPNRDGTISHGGCIFCDEGGSFSQAHSNVLSVEEQVEAGAAVLSQRFGAQKFMSYFQAYSNTYKPADELEKIYKSALKHPDVVGISIGTRPDCVDEEKLDLIAGLGCYTWIEYGLQSSHNKTLERLNRGHDRECFVRAYEMTKQRGLNVCVHVILGLPGESHDEMMQTAQRLAALGVDGVKIHVLCVLEGTQLAQMDMNFMDENEYVCTVCDFLEHLPLQTTIHRLAGNGLKKNLIAPRWLGKKFDTLNKIDRELERRGSFQGKAYKCKDCK